MSQPKPVTSIFLADDDEDDIELFGEMLTDLFGHVRLQVAVNGLELIRLLKAAPTLPDIIFLDMNMPIKNGIQCLQEIKEHSPWEAIRTVILSTSSSPEQIEAARTRGADCYMVKSTSFTQFRQDLAACINNQIEKKDFIIGKA